MKSISLENKRALYIIEYSEKEIKNLKKLIEVDRLIIKKYKKAIKLGEVE